MLQTDGTTPFARSCRKTPGATVSRLSDVLEGRARWAVELGDSAIVLKALPDACVDAIVTDPPAGIEFMSNEWDTFKRGRGDNARDTFVAAMTPIFADALRVLKPGAHALVWALPRTSHWTATALEDAGFQVRDVVTHHFGTGFTKSLDVAKAIDRQRSDRSDVLEVTLPARDEAREWQGLGTALKPATEHWILARRPLVGTVVANVLEHGTGALNIDGCRVRAPGGSPAADRRATAARTGNVPGAKGKKAAESNAEGKIQQRSNFEAYTAERAGEALGRWPANLVLSHAPECVPLGTAEVRGSNFAGHPGGRIQSVYGQHHRVRPPAGYADEDGFERIEAWDCAPGCPVAEIDAQSGAGTSRKGKLREGKNGNGWGMTSTGSEYSDRGGASRFFPTFRYQGKASTRERVEGLPPGAKNRHPTVKSIELMRWLCRLITPSGGLVLDPFNGSGSTGVAALAEGFRYIGIEREAEYRDVAVARIAHAEKAVETMLPLSPSSGSSALHVPRCFRAARRRRAQCSTTEGAQGVLFPEIGVLE